MKFRYAIALPVAALLSSCGQQPEVSMKDFMAKQVQPTAQTYWDAVQFINDETGVHDIYPKTDADWEKTRKAAEDMRKFGELLQTDAYAKGRNPDWKQFAQGLVDISKQAEQAAKDKSADKVFEVGGTMYSVCSACHTIYPPPVPASTPIPNTGGAPG
ncbi:MAG: hypothetical protein P0Y56_17110 [Candidatus Andeanibacterium colombiense]|uniref:Cytochrome c n=1 Tax=Candidatus Andeanibacterium colombiense TaxID=3121345 RepID=A0AAJ5X654_9SPHN|nr:MAG: hypothetical protein P0Y56_17110 [Sphingomonadaceae bacterium]